MSELSSHWSARYVLIVGPLCQSGLSSVLLYTMYVLMVGPLCQGGIGDLLDMY